MRGVVPEALVSRKVVYREVCTEGGVSVEMSGGHLEVIDPTVGQTINPVLTACPESFRETETVYEA